MARTLPDRRTSKHLRFTGTGRRARVTTVMSRNNN